MTRALLLPLTTMLALATAAGMIGLALSLRPEPIVVSPTTIATPSTPATPAETALPVGESLFAQFPVPLPARPVVLTVARLVLRPAEILPPTGASEPIVLLVESGAVAVGLTDSATPQTGLDVAQSDTFLQPGQEVVVDAGTIRTIRNTGETPAVVLSMTITDDTTAPDQRQTDPA